MIRNLIKFSLKLTCYLLGMLKPRREIPVLVYHSIDNTNSVLSVSPDTLRKQFKFFRDKGYETLSLEDYFRHRKENKSLDKKLLITFDDGYQNMYTGAFPILKEFSFSAVIFLVTDHIGKTANWILRDSKIIEERLTSSLSAAEVDLDAEAKRQQEIANYPLLTWDEVEEMHAGGVDFQSHSHSHHFISTLDETDLHKELALSREILEEKLKKKITGFCYPYCDYEHPQASRQLVETGYEGAFIGDRLNGEPRYPEEFYITRVPVWEFTTPFDFKLFFSPGYDIYKSIVKFARGILKPG